MTDIWSQIIEIPHLGEADCALVSGVPKRVGQSWTFLGIDDPSTTRLRVSISGTWEITSQGFDEIACAAANQSSGDTAGSIYVYPMAYITVPWRGSADNMVSYSPGLFNIINQNRIQVNAKKVTQDNIVVGNQMYFNQATGRVTKTASSQYLYVGAASIAAPSGSSDVHVPVTYAYSDNTVTPTELDMTLVPHISGDPTWTALQPLAEDISGNYFQASLLKYGEYRGVIAADSPPTSATTVRVYDLTNNKMTTENMQLMFSALNPMMCLLVPSFGSNTIEFLTNRKTTDIYQYGSTPPFGYTYQRTYEYKYRLRKYRTVKTTAKTTTDAGSNAPLLTSTGWKPNIVMDIPSITWTRQGTDAAPYSPPGALDLSDRKLILHGTGNQYNWQIWKQTTDGMYRTYVDADLPLRHQSLGGDGIFPIVKSHDGESDICLPSVMTGRQSWVTQPGLDEAWEFTIGSFEGGAGDGTMRFSYSVWRADQDGEHMIKDWSDMARSAWFTQGSTHFLKFTFSLSLTSCGETNPYIRMNNYYIKLRQYYIAISPYQSYTVPWGQHDYWLPNTNAAGVATKYDSIYAYAYPFPYDKKQSHLMRTDGSAVIDSDDIIGYHPQMKRFTTTFAGSGVTFSVQSAFNGMKKWNISYDITPTLTEPAEYQWVYAHSFCCSLRRKSDGMYLDEHIPQTSTTATGCTWSTVARQNEIVTTSTTNGTTPQTSSLVCQATYQYYLVDLKPGLLTDDYEIEVVIGWKFYFRNQLTPKIITKRYTHTFSW